MAKCKICKKNIPEGTEYCTECLDKQKVMVNESYLDSLLNSVKNTATANESIYKKRPNSDADTIDPAVDIVSGSDEKDSEFFNYDLSDIKDFDQLNLDEDLENINDDEIINDEKLFGKDLSEIFSDEDSVKKESDEKNNTKNLVDSFDADLNSSNLNHVEAEAEAEAETNAETNADTNAETNADINADTNAEADANAEIKERVLDYKNLHNDSIENQSVTSLNTENPSDSIDTKDNTTDSDLSKESEIEDISKKNVNTKDMNDFSDDNGYDTDINELLGQLDMQDDNNKNDIKDGNTIIDTDDEYNKNAAIEKKSPEDKNDTTKTDEEDDFMSLLNQISADDPVVDDVKAINDLMNGAVTEPSKDTNMPSDVGEVFSDALKAVSDLNDPKLNEAELLDQIPNKKGKKSKKKKKDKKKKSKTESSNEDGSTEDKPKIGLLKRLFGNVEDKNAPKKKASIDNQTDGEKNETIEVSNKGKTKKAKKSKKGKGDSDNEALDKSKDAAENKKAKKKDKKEKKLKKQKSNDVVQVIDDLDEDLGRINRVGASIVFVFFVLLAILIYAGSNAVSYTLGIQHATQYFQEREYTQAYEKVEGMQIKAEDVRIYKKILTVMFVNKQLNSYNNYCTIGKYPQALDSLLKGLQRYDKYKQLATLLGIKTDMDYVRKQILAELNHQFNLSEKEAFNIINIDDRNDYSSKVYEVAEKDNNND